MRFSGSFPDSLAFVFTVVIGIPALALSFFDRSGPGGSSFQKAWVSCLLRTNRIRVRAEGLENLKEHRACILISNRLMEEVRGIIIANQADFAPVDLAEKRKEREKTGS